MSVIPSAQRAVTTCECDFPTVNHPPLLSPSNGALIIMDNNLINYSTQTIEFGSLIAYFPPQSFHVPIIIQEVALPHIVARLIIIIVVRSTNQDHSGGEGGECKVMFRYPGSPLTSSTNQGSWSSIYFLIWVECLADHNLRESLQPPNSKPIGLGWISPYCANVAFHVSSTANQGLYRRLPSSSCSGSR